MQKMALARIGKALARIERHRHASESIGTQTEASNQRERESHQAFERVNKAKLSCFPEALKNYFSKSRVLIR